MDTTPQLEVTTCLYITHVAIESEDNLIEDVDGIKSLVLGHFKTRFTEPDFKRPKWRMSLLTSSMLRKVQIWKHISPRGY